VASWWKVGAATDATYFQRCGVNGGAIKGDNSKEKGHLRGMPLDHTHAALQPYQQASDPIRARSVPRARKPFDQKQSLHPHRKKKSKQEKEGPNLMSPFISNKSRISSSSSVRISDSVSVSVSVRVMVRVSTVPILSKGGAP
jgi:hypothetical protein